MRVEATQVPAGQGALVCTELLSSLVATARLLDRFARAAAAAAKGGPEEGPEALDGVGERTLRWPGRPT